MLASGCSPGFGAGWPGVLRRVLSVVYSSASDVKSFRVCFRYGMVRWVYSLVPSLAFLALELSYLSVMGSRGTNNSLQTAPLMSTPPTGDDDVANIPSTSQSGGTLEGLPAMDASGEAGISLAIVSLITQTVRAALAAERGNTPPSSLASTPPIPSVPSPSVPSTMTSACSGGVPPLLSSSTHAFLTAGAGVAGLRFQVGLFSLCLLLYLPLFLRLPIRRYPFPARRARSIRRPVRLAMSQIVLLCLLRLSWINLLSLAPGSRLCRPSLLLKSWPASTSTWANCWRLIWCRRIRNRSCYWTDVSCWLLSPRSSVIVLMISPHGWRPSPFSRWFWSPVSPTAGKI